MRRHIVFGLFIIIGLLGVAAFLFISNDYLFRFDTSTPRTITEVGLSSEDLILTSGGALVVENGVGRTLNKPTTPDDVWYNAGGVDPERISNPQEVFRVTTPQISDSWKNYSIKLVLTPTKHIQSTSSSVDQTNGIYLFMYYHNQDNLYLGGITVDGRLYIKRKATIGDASYYGLMAEEKIFPGEYKPNGNLIQPFEESRITLEGTIRNMDNGNVRVSIFVEIADKDGKIIVSREIVGIDDGNLVAQGDNTKTLGLPEYDGRAGFRLDFIEAVFHEFSVRPVR